MAEKEVITVVVVGDQGTGKTSMITAYVEDHFVAKYLPTVTDKKLHEMMLRGNAVTVQIWDTGMCHCVLEGVHCCCQKKNEKKKGRNIRYVYKLTFAFVRVFFLILYSRLGRV
jgi:Ni2+-binding GTPase involved in maturation of urease and hydrogenase